jgi:hypothetical protein
MRPRSDTKMVEWWIIPVMMLVAGIVFVALSFVA